MTFPNITVRFVFISVTMFIFLMSGSVRAQGQNAILWENDLEKAKQRAAAENKPLLLHFYGDSCPPCIVMDRDYFPNAGVIEKLNTEFVAVKINTAQQPHLMAPYGVQRIPTDVYLAPNGEKLHTRTGIGKTVGIAQPSDLVAEMTEIAARVSKAAATELQLAQGQASDQNALPTQAVAGVMLAEYHRPGFVDHSQTIQQSQNHIEEMEGFAVSGKATNPDSQNIADVQDRIILPTQYLSAPEQTTGVLTAQNTTQNLQLQNAQVSDVRPQYFNAPAHEMSVPANQQQPLLTAQNTPASNAVTPLQDQFVAQPQPQVTLTQHAVQTTGPDLTPHSAGVVAGAFEGGIVRKQPTVGLGAGVSLGVLSATDQKSTVAEMPKIALDGYCPVSLAQQAKWVKGNTEITADHDGIIFRFVSEEAKNTFAVNPELYAPVLRGNDVVEMLTNRRDMTGSRKFGAWYHGRVFLFSCADNFEKFQNNPELYAFLATQQPAETLASQTVVQPR